MLVDVPDVAGLERRGRSLRAAPGRLVAAAVVLALVGTWVLRDSYPKAVEPAGPMPGLSQPYPGNQMKTLKAGTYELAPSNVLGEPTVLLTVPKGWNAWEGPNRFDGHRPGQTNTQALERRTWFVSVLVVKVVGVIRDVCWKPVQPRPVATCHHASRPSRRAWWTRSSSCRE